MQCIYHSSEFVARFWIISWMCPLRIWSMPALIKTLFYYSFLYLWFLIFLCSCLC